MTVKTKRPPVYTLPPAGSPAGLQLRDEFISKLHAIIGGPDNMRLLWLPKMSDTTTTTSAEKDARTFTYAVSIAAKKSQLGSGVAVAFDGAADYATVPDADDFSFGNDVADAPFSIVGLVKTTASGTAKSILDKRNAGAAREWEYKVDATTGFHASQLYSLAAATNIIGRVTGADITGSWKLLSMTYDGTRGESGLSNFTGSARSDAGTAGANPLSYVAMTPGTAVVTLGCRASDTPSQFFLGSMALVMLVARQLYQDEIAAITYGCNGFFNLALT